MNGILPEFDDPQLKVTLRRATAGAGATSELRDRMAGLIAREMGADAPPVRSPWRIRPAWIATAAAILLVASLGGGYLRHRHHEAEEREEYLAANLPLFNDMIRAHAGTAGSTPETLMVSLDDRDGVRKSLTTKLGRAVPVPDWRATGWRLAGAWVGIVGKHHAAQLRYENAGRSILFVSLPAAAYSGHEGEEPEPYEYTVGGHSIWGFVKDGGLHCVVGDRVMTPGEIAGLKVD